MANQIENSLMRSQAYVGGEWIDASSAAILEVVDPATGDVLNSVPDLSHAEMELAIVHAHRALSGWKSRLAGERATLLQEWHRLILENLDPLSQLLTLEQGKPITESISEIRYAASFIEWFAEEGKRLYGEVIPQHLPDKRILVTRQAVGVVAAITPWNFPAAMITRKVAPALAAGCTVVVKPSPETPLTALALADLAEKAGIPSGVLNVITTSDNTTAGKLLTSDVRVAKISFTGSTQVGKLLMAQSATTLKKVSLELGGNAPFLVFEDADLDQAVEGAVASKYRNAGQTCVCANRFLIQDSIVDPFVEKMTARIQLLRVGNGLMRGVDQGPLIHEQAVQKVERLIQEALREGATLCCGGSRHALGGSFFQPTLIRNVTPNMRIAREEVFGPVAPILVFKSDDEAIEMANNTRSGLAAYFYTQNLHRFWRVSERLEYGIVGHNTGIVSTEIAPFGGMKESGIGREGSRHGILDYTELKYVCTEIG